MKAAARVVALVSCGVVLAGCSAAVGDTHASVGDNTGQTGAPTGASQTSALKPLHPRVRLVSSHHHSVSWRGPVVFKAADATIVSATVRGGPDPVSGAVHAQGARWRSTGLLTPSTSYHAAVRLRTSTGQRITRAIRFSTTKPDSTLSLTATPGPGYVVGVGEPIVVNFNQPVTDEAAVQKRMSVMAGSEHIKGSWHWFSSTLVHYRPKKYWPANTEIKVGIDLANLYVGHGVWGDRNHDWTWHTGNAHISYVNSVKHTFTVTSNGKRIAVWPTGTGMPGFDTRSGTYVVLDKSPTVEMTSCSVGLSCTPGTANYYDLQVSWDTRVTDSGTFVHAAPWDSEMGVANTSHGCIHLATTHARSFYHMSLPGDIVTLTGSPRPPNPDDPGMMDWNMSWSQWRAGSALH
ncbi:MAG: Ig-like domain-containing protein [Nocardioidaceae bacterium]